MMRKAKMKPPNPRLLFSYRARAAIGFGLLIVATCFASFFFIDDQESRAAIVKSTITSLALVCGGLLAARTIRFGQDNLLSGRTDSNEGPKCQPDFHGTFAPR